MADADDCEETIRATCVALGLEEVNAGTYKLTQDNGTLEVFVMRAPFRVCVVRHWHDLLISQTDIVYLDNAPEVIAKDVADLRGVT